MLQRKCFPPCSAEWFDQTGIGCATLQIHQMIKREFHLDRRRGSAEQR
jgi:hypothetical protein